MKTSDFDYELPEELIAQTPVEPRDHSRLMVVHRATGEREDKHFYDIIDYLNPNDALVINETKADPFREALRKAGFYAEWKKKYGDEAWAILEKAVGSSLS